MVEYLKARCSIHQKRVKNVSHFCQGCFSNLSVLAVIIGLWKLEKPISKIPVFRKLFTQFERKRSMPDALSGLLQQVVFLNKYLRLYKLQNEFIEASNISGLKSPVKNIFS